MRWVTSLLVLVLASVVLGCSSGDDPTAADAVGSNDTASSTASAPSTTVESPTSTSSTTSVSASTTSVSPSTTSESTDAIAEESTLPGWAPAGWTQAELDEAIDLIEETLVATGESFQVIDGTAVSDDWVISFDNLLRELDQADRSEWPERVERWVRISLEVAAVEAEPPGLDALRVAVREEIPSPAISGEVTPGLVWGVVFDFPDAVRYVTDEDLADLEMGEEELLATASAATMTHEPSVELLETDFGVDLWFVDGDYYASSFILFPEVLDLPEAPHGWLAIVPTRDLLVLSPVESASTLRDAAEVLSWLAGDLYETEPGPLSSMLFYVIDGQIAPVFEVLDGQFAFPQELLDFDRLPD